MCATNVCSAPWPDLPSPPWRHSDPRGEVGAALPGKTIPRPLNEKWTRSKINKHRTRRCVVDTCKEIRVHKEVRALNLHDDGGTSPGLSQTWSWRHLGTRPRACLLGGVFALSAPCKHLRFRQYETPPWSCGGTRVGVSGPQNGHLAISFHTQTHRHPLCIFLF